MRADAFAELKKEQKHPTFLSKNASRVEWKMDARPSFPLALFRSHPYRLNYLHRIWPVGTPILHWRKNYSSLTGRHIRCNGHSRRLTSSFSDWLYKKVFLLLVPSTAECQGGHICCNKWGVLFAPVICVFALGWHVVKKSSNFWYATWPWGIFRHQLHKHGWLIL